MYIYIYIDTHIFLCFAKFFKTSIIDKLQIKYEIRQQFN